MGEGMCRHGAACFFKPIDRLVDARLHQMCDPYPEEPLANFAIARTQPNGSLYERDHFLDRPGIELAAAKLRVSDRPVAIRCNGAFEFENGFLVPVLRSKHLASGVMRKRIAGPRCQGLFYKCFC